MSGLITQDINNITATHFAFDYLSVNANVDQDDTEKLLINQYDTDKFTLIARQNGLAIKTSREKAKQMSDYSLYVDGNAHISGVLHASNINIMGNSISDNNTALIVEAINNTSTPFRQVNTVDNDIINYNIQHNLNIANDINSFSNLHALQVNALADNTIKRSQLAIRNEVANPDTGEKSQILIGIPGNNYDSPAVIATNSGKALEFHISNTLDEIDNPTINTVAVTIDVSNCLCINTSNSKDLIYSVDHYTSSSNTTKLNVNGLAYIDDIVTHDYTSGTHKHLNDIFMRKDDQTFYPEQMYSGIFSGNFIFDSNVHISSLETNDLYVNGDHAITEINGERFSVFTPAYFNNKTYFTDVVFESTNLINFVGNLQQNGKNVNVTDIEYKYIHTDHETVLDAIPNNTFYTEHEIVSNIHWFSHYEGLVDNNKLLGISDSVSTPIVNNITELFQPDISESDLLQKNNIIEDIVDKLSNNGIASTVAYVETNYKIIDSTDLYNRIQYDTLSNEIIKSLTLYDEINVNHNIYDHVLHRSINSIGNVVNGYVEQDHVNHYTINDYFNGDILSNMLVFVNVDHSPLSDDDSVFQQISNIGNINSILNNGLSNLYDILHSDQIDLDADVDREDYFDKLIEHYSNNKFPLVSSDHLISSDHVINDLYVYLSNVGIKDIDTSISDIHIVNTIDYNDIHEHLSSNQLYNNTFLYTLNSVKNTIKTNLQNNGVSKFSSSGYLEDFEEFDSNIQSNLFSYTNISNILDPYYNNLHIDSYVASIVSEHLKINGILNLLDTLDQFKYKDISEKNRFGLNIITNYDTTSTFDKTILSYAVKDGINTDGSNIHISGRLGVGINNDTYPSMLNVIRRKDINSSEILIKDISTDITTDTPYEVHIGHLRGNYGDNNEFAIATNERMSDHHIAFYPGVSPRLSDGVDQYNPSVFMQCGTGNVGINTKLPEKHLHIHGDIQVDGNTFKRIGNQSVRASQLVESTSNDKLLVLDNRKQFDRILLDNVSSLDLSSGTINAKSFVINGEELYTFKRDKFSGNFEINENFNVGLKDLLKSSIWNAALQVRNSSHLGMNNSVIRIFRSQANSDDFDRYTGIEISQYPNKPHIGWYLHNEHDVDDGEVFSIGYRSDNLNKHSMIKGIYNSSDTSCSTTIDGNLNVKGDVNISGTYKINGIEITDNTIQTSTSSIAENAKLDENDHLEQDITITGDRLINLVKRHSSFYITEPTIFFKRFMYNHKLHVSSETDSKLHVIQPQYSLNKRPNASFSTYSETDGTKCFANIRVGILNRHILSNPKPWLQESYADFEIAEQDNSRIALDLKLHSKHNTSANDTVMSIYDEGTKLFTKFGRNYTEHIDAFFHVADDNETLMYLQNDTHPVKITMDYADTKWHIESDSKFHVYTNKDLPSLSINTDNKIGINTSSPKYTLDIVNTDITSPCLNITNVNSTSKNIDDDITQLVDLKIDKIRDPSFIISDALWTLDITKYDGSYRLDDVNTCNFIINKQILFTEITLYNQPFSESIYSKVTDINIDWQVDYNIQTHNLYNVFTIGPKTAYSYTLNSSDQNSIDTSKVSDNTSFNGQPYYQSTVDMYHVSYDQFNNFNTFYLKPIQVQLLTQNNNKQKQYNFELFLYRTIDENNIDGQFYGSDSMWIEILNYTSNILTDIDVDNDLDIRVNTKIYKHKDYVNVFTGEIYGSIDITQDVNVELMKGINDTQISTEYISGTSETLDTFRLEYLSNIHVDNIVECNINAKMSRSISLFDDDHLYSIDVERDILLKYESLYTTDPEAVVSIDVVLKDFVPHIMLNNRLGSSDLNQSHLIISQDSKYEIFYDEPNVSYNKILSVDKNGSLTVKSLYVEDVYITGEIYDHLDMLLKEQRVNELDKIEVHDKPLYLRSDNNKVLINSDVPPPDDSGISSAVVMIGNNDYTSDNLLTLYNKLSDNAFLYIQNNTSDLCKIGVQNNKMIIGYKDISALEIIPKEDNSFVYKFNGKIEYTNSIASIDVGDIKLTSRGIINDNISTSDDNVFEIINRKQSETDIIDDSIISMKADEIITHKFLNCQGGTSTVSDRRIKSNIVKIDNALTKLNALTGVFYDNNISRKRECGLIAQDVLNILPEAVIVPNKSDDLLGIQYGNIVGLLVEGFKELKREINEIKNIINTTK